MDPLRFAGPVRRPAIGYRSRKAPRYCSTCSPTSGARNSPAASPGKPARSPSKTTAAPSTIRSTTTTAVAASCTA